MTGLKTNSDGGESGGKYIGILGHMVVTVYNSTS